MNNFKIIGLKVTFHPYLGDITAPGLEFVSEGEEKNGPYSTVIIGPNGTGKSQILRLIADIFEELKAHSKNTDSYKLKLRYQFEMVLMKGAHYYQVEYRRRYHLSREEKRLKEFKSLQIFLLKDRGLEKVKEIDNDGCYLPEMIVSNSFLVNDKFRFVRRSDEPLYYNYLGVRDSAGTARTRSYVRTIINMLFKDISDHKNLAGIKKILGYIGYDPTYLGISYKIRYTGSFFAGDLSEKSFVELFDNPKSFSVREKAFFALSFFKTIREDSFRIKRIVSAINVIAAELKIKQRYRSQIAINLLDERFGLETLSWFDDLLKLDLIESPSISFKKMTGQATASEIGVDKFSSGEFNLFASLIGLRSLVKTNSLVLIDEPEISLHPNWQMKYIHFLKEIFSDLPSVHFVVATHSHFLVSDLKNESSEIIKLGRSGEKLKYYSIKGDTYGQSAENILYNIFGLRSSRNYYFEVEIRELLTLISNHNAVANEDYLIQTINTQIEKLSAYTIDGNDPLNLILEEAREFIRNR
jgi:predicted ATPase